uniref:Uncharacterized protein n=1 Tax=Cucumis melo TaxID=3656 RepID=A0A9I9DPL5_CUCME
MKSQRQFQWQHTSKIIHPERRRENREKQNDRAKRGGESNDIYDCEHHVQRLSDKHRRASFTIETTRDTKSRSKDDGSNENSDSSASLRGSLEPLFATIKHFLMCFIEELTWLPSSIVVVRCIERRDGIVNPFEPFELMSKL